MEYLVFDKFIKDLNSAPFSLSCKLFDKLGIKYENYSDGSEFGFGYEKRYMSPDSFDGGFKNILTRGKDENKSIICLENNAYLGMKKASSELGIDANVEIALDVLAQHFSDKSKLVHSFEDFNIGYFQGDSKEANFESAKTLIENTKATYIKLKTEHFNDGYGLLDVDEKMAYEFAGEILYDAYDSGCDFLVVNDLRTFYIFDTLQKKIAKTKKRPLGENGMPVLSMAELIMIAQGDADKSQNHTDTHKTNVYFI